MMQLRPVVPSRSLRTILSPNCQGASETGDVLCPSTHSVRAHLRLGMYHVLVLAELQRICRTGAQGDGSLLNALSRKCYMCMLLSRSTSEGFRVWEGAVRYPGGVSI